MDQDRDMERSPRRKGVCVVTIMWQPTGLLITVTTRLDVEAVARETTRAATTVDEAVEALREFLLHFTSLTT